MTTFRKTLVGLIALGTSLLSSSVQGAEGYLEVSEKHQIYYSSYGNENGIPVVVLHGGPGLGCNEKDSRFFDLSRYFVVMFDQRGAMRSKPFGCMDENTTQDSIRDIEALRKHLGIEKWAVFGGSWGSLLAVVYGQAHPESCLGFVLRGIFLGREQDIRLFCVNEETATEAHQEFLRQIPKDEQNDLLAASYKKVMDPDPEVHVNFAKNFMRYHLLRTSNSPNSVIEKILQNEQLVVSMVRAVLHYASHQLFLQPNQILSNMERIAQLPAVIVHGSADINCLPEQARLLHQNWERSRLWMIDAGGHSADDPAIAPALLKATNSLADQLASDAPASQANVPWEASGCS